MYYVNENIDRLYRIGSMEGRNEYLRLDMNENPEGLPSEFVKKVLGEITSEFLAMYPEVNTVEGLLADRLGFLIGNICLCNGSDEAIRLIFQTFGKKGDKAVMVMPSFEMYRIYSEMFGMRYTPVEISNSFKIPTEKIIEEIDKETGIVVLLNPNNPVGQSYNISEVEKVIVKALNNDAIVIIDEAYHYFYEKTFISLVHKYDNLFVLRTFSKIFSIAALRVGFVTGSEKLISYIKKALSSYNVNSVALLFVKEFLKDKDLLSLLIRNEAEGKKYIVDILMKRGYEVYTQDGNFIFIKPTRQPKEISDILKDNKILVKTYKYDLLKDYIRVTTGSIKVMEQFLDAFLKADTETGLK